MPTFRKPVSSMPCRHTTLILSLLLLAFPSVTLALPSGGNAVMFLAVAASLILLVTGGKLGVPMADTADAGVRAFVVALLLPIAAILVSNIAHGRLVPNTFDSPARFLLAIPLFVGLRRVSRSLAPWTDLAFALGGIVAGAVAFADSTLRTGTRAESALLNPIHFGDIALIIGALSLLSIRWRRHDQQWVKWLKAAGFLAGGYASWASQTRGGWVALPVIVVICLAVEMRRRSLRAKLGVAALAIACVVLPLVLSATVQARFLSVASDLHALAEGQVDTSVGVRLELWRTALGLFRDNLLFGLGPHGFHDAMAPMAAAGKLTAMAADLGRGEVHNQLLAYAADYGTLGLIAMLSLYACPAWLFWRGLRQPAREQSRAALMGLVLVTGFFIFGLTVETFNLKVTAAFYATLLAVFAAFTYPAESSTKCAR
ncbi:O-antigen polymerase [Pandoraea terrae]|uniref:O-antigen polymerase n=1 Tax=Pandoraea terrae TaxID=1537710 RepID=A0A5E4TRW5_9BURK|nr:O-antigen ligase family protein [Pandoraea terrae]VVD90507.1 O-antigen polymerase [Pandoraea terrae]